MGMFVDANGNEINEVTAENIEYYKKWLQTDKNPDVSHLFNSNDVSLADLAVSPYLDDKQTAAAAMMVCRDVASNPEKNRLNEYIDLAKKNRPVVAESWMSMVNWRAFEDVLHTMNKRPAAENLAFMLASMEARIPNVDHYTGKPDDFSKISGENKKYAEELLNLAAPVYLKGRYDGSDPKTSISYMCVKGLIQNGSMINLKTSTENREVISKAIMNNEYRYVLKNLEALKPEYLNEEMLKRLATKYAPAQQYKDTKGAKTQAEKNVNILPKGYLNFKKAVLNLINKQDKYDRTNYGEERGLNERYLEVCKKIDVSEGIARNPKCMAGLYLETARKDIEEGRVARLDKTALSDVLKHDDGKYLAMLPQEFVQNNKDLIESSLPKNAKISLAEQNVAGAYNFSIASLGRRNRTTKENKKILENLEAEQKKIGPKIDYLQKDKEEIEQLQQTATAKYNIFAAEENNAKAIFSLQDGYDSIKRYMKEGKDAEQILSKEAVEKVIAERLEGKNSILQMPQEGSLPIMFGRKDEKERRERLANKITEFNQRMDSVVPYLKKEYAGEILSPDAYNQALKKTETTKQEYNNAAYNHSSRLISQGRQNTNELEDLTQRNNFIEQARERIQEKETKKKEVVKKLVGVPDKTAVQTVPQNAEKAEKAQIRRQNKQVEDKLATKEKTFAGKSDAEKVGLQKQRQNQAMR
ncbi:MAG: hypothetical protein MSS98_03530 [Alphaproteobacteria bacterium]|nr:hypothetical protein [Alphaproteobacteria bacterium]